MHARIHDFQEKKCRPKRLVKLKRAATVSQKKYESLRFANQHTKVTAWMASKTYQSMG